MLSIGYLLLLLTTSVEAFIRNRCHIIYNLLFTSKYSVFKRLICIPIGYSIGQIFFSYVIYRFDFEDRMQNVIRYTIVALITVSFSLSIQMRAICCLVLPTFFGEYRYEIDFRRELRSHLILGRIMRNFLIASVILSLINRPLLNSVDNSVGLSKWLFCTISKGVEQGSQASRLLIEPARDVMLGLAVKGIASLDNNSRYHSELDSSRIGISKIPKVEKKANKADFYQQYREELKQICADIERNLENCYNSMIKPLFSFWTRLAFLTS